MTKFLCKIVGHREFSNEVLAHRPWEDRDFSRYPITAFREQKCLRCHDSLTD